MSPDAANAAPPVIVPDAPAPAPQCASTGQHMPIPCVTQAFAPEQQPSRIVLGSHRPRKVPVLVVTGARCAFCGVPCGKLACVDPEGVVFLAEFGVPEAVAAPAVTL